MRLSSGCESHSFLRSRSHRNGTRSTSCSAPSGADRGDHFLRGSRIFDPNTGSPVSFSSSATRIRSRRLSSLVGAFIVRDACNHEDLRAVHVVRPQVQIIAVLATSRSPFFGAVRVDRNSGVGGDVLRKGAGCGAVVESRNGSEVHGGSFVVSN